LVVFPIKKPDGCLQSSNVFDESIDRGSMRLFTVMMTQKWFWSEWEELEGERGQRIKL